MKFEKSNPPEIDFCKIQNGDVEEYEFLFRFYYAVLVEFALYYVTDQQTAESIVQDVFVNVWNNRNKIKLRSTIKVYLYSATKKESFRYLRDKKIRNRYVQSLLSIEDLQIVCDDSAHQKEIRNAIENAIRELPKKGQLIFCMNRFDELTYAEIARILGISVKTVETHMSRALKYLRKKLSHLLFF